ncbi:DUF2062 domain-containing protein [Halomonas huangheensis]|nr:DUF2062 domain-containing protein [Halomonas huangheensis]ALM54585.1 ATP-binding protein [Halomonas huangheensis]
MPRRLLQRYLPRPDTLKQHRSLRFMAHLIADPALWVLSRRSVANAFAIGLFSALLPIPFQMVIAAFAARAVRCNLPLSVALVWITNPLTMPIIYYANYCVGAWLLQTHALHAPDQITIEWLRAQIMEILPSLILGSLVSAIALALCGYLVIRLLWRWQVSRSWRARARRRRARNECAN